MADGPVKSFNENDPLEAIYALNIGDFMAESFISDDLLSKISDSLSGNPDKLRKQLEELVQIYSIDKTLGILGFSTDEGFIIYDSIASTLARMFEVDVCQIFQIATRDTGEEYLSLTGTSLDVPNDSRWKIGVQIRANDLLSDIYRTSGTTCLDTLKNAPHWNPIEALGQKNTQALLAAPMMEGSRRLGVVLFESYSPKTFSQELKALAEATAQVFVTSVRLQQLIAQAQLQIAHEDCPVEELRNLRAQITENIADLGSHQQVFVECLGDAIDARQDFTRGHSRRVAHVAKTIADWMDLNEKTVDLVYCAGLLGTIGKMDIPGQVLTKQDKLSKAEWDELRNHPNVGVGLLVQINFLSEVIPYVHYQHERWDGSGNPEGRVGRNIPLGSRILAVADAYQAMTTPRPYRGAGMAHAEALKQIQSEVGTKWDPDVVAAFARIPAEALL